MVFTLYSSLGSQAKARFGFKSCPASQVCEREGGRERQVPQRRYTWIRWFAGCLVIIRIRLAYANCPCAVPFCCKLHKPLSNLMWQLFWWQRDFHALHWSSGNVMIRLLELSEQSEESTKSRQAKVKHKFQHLPHKYKHTQIQAQANLTIPCTKTVRNIGNLFLHQETILWSETFSYVKKERYGIHLDGQGRHSSTMTVSPDLQNMRVHLAEWMSHQRWAENFGLHSNLVVSSLNYEFQTPI